MRIMLTALLCILLATDTVTNAAAQDFVATPVEVSTEKVKVQGIVYYLHKVLKGHTLYSISKAYGVDAEDIRKANPSLQEGLKAGMLLYIPEAAPAGITTAGNTQDADTSAVSAGQKISGKEETPAAKDRREKRQTRKYRRYNVKWYETLDDVAVKFNVTTDALIALNGIDPDSDKRIRSVLIPDERYMKDFREGRSGQDQELVSGDSGNAGNAEGQGTYTADGIQGFSDNPKTVLPGEPYNSGMYTISLVLPFNASRLTSGMNAYTADFYAGTIIAMADLKERGMFSSFILNVVDLNRYSSAWEAVADNALRGSELIIGPISERDMQPIASYAKNEGIPIVSPLDVNTASLAEGNPCFYLFPPQSDLALSHQIDKIEQARNNGGKESVTVIYEQGYDNSSLVTRTIGELESRGIPYRTFKYDFLSGRGIDSRMYQSLDAASVNRVIIPSMSEAFVTDALRNLNLIKSSRNCRIEVYGMSRWKSFETAELEYFHSLELRLAMSYHIDYNSPETMEFIRKYKAAFNTEPTSFSFQGYDILTFFVNAMNYWGKNFPQGIINERKSLLQSDVLFLPAGSGSGYENHAFKDICFTDGWVVREE